MIIALDGPAGSGKSTIAREVAKRLGMRYLDTGAMYRTVTLLALERGLLPDRIDQAGALAAATDMRFVERPNDLTRVFVGDREVTDEIRGRLVSQNVSAVSADALVRSVLTEKQRREVARGDVVLEGRDMGTVVAPDADVKVFLTASVQERARRRQLQLQAQGVSQPLEELIADISARDAYDSGRELAPLRRAGDAVEIDTTGMTIEEVIEAVCGLASARDGRVCSVAGVAQKPSKWPLSRLTRSPLDTWLYRFAYRLLRPATRVFFRMRVSGVEHIPASGAVVVACNHRSNLDPFFAGCACSRQVHYMAKAELWKCRPAGYALRKLGSFPVRRGEADRKAIKHALEIMDEGGVLGLFPEGHRHRDTELGEIRPGVSLFSLREGAVTVPVILRGTDRIVRHGILCFPRVTVTFGPPIELPADELPRSEKAAITTQRLIDAFHQLLAVTAEK